jgi:uncharacterized repeat protein (TIGR01451 family)
LLLFGCTVFHSSKSHALSCPDATLSNPTDVLVATYYLTATTCTLSDPGAGVLLSARIDDNDVSVTFFPNTTIVSSSVTTGAGCTHAITPTSGNVAGYLFGNSTTCSVSITLSNGGSLSFAADDAADGYANSFTSVVFTAGSTPAWTLAAVPSPTSFTAAGQAIGYSYTLTNTGNVAISSIALTGSKTGTISCPASSLAAGANMTCTSTYTTLAGDVGAAIPYTATATGTPAGGTLANAVASGSISFTAQPALAIAVTTSPTTFSNAGQVIAYSYKVTNTGNVAVNSLGVTDTRVGGIVCPLATLPPGAITTCAGTYTTTAADVIAGSVTGTARAQGVASTGAVQSPPITTTLQLDANAVRQATQSANRAFMVHRADMIASMSPDTSRMHQRLSGWLFASDDEEAGSRRDATAAARRQPDGLAPDDRIGRWPGRGVGSDRSPRVGMNPLNFNGSTDDGSGRFAFATSLAQIRQAAAGSAQVAQEGSAEPRMGLGAVPPRQLGGRVQPPPFDLWAEGAMSYYEDGATGARRQGHAGLLYIGADYRIHPAILVGLLAQFDWLSETASSLGTSASGQGWMAGPYVSMRLTRNLFFDGRAAWGQADNSVDPLGIYTDNFSTERGLVSGKLTGYWASGALLFRPSAEILYFHETQKAYVGSLGFLIPEQSISLGRISFGPEVAHRFRQTDGSSFEPYVGLKGVWDFAKTADVSVAGIAVGSDEFRGKVELGATYATPFGVSSRGSISYDGIGSRDFHAVQGRASVAIPLN